MLTKNSNTAKAVLIATTMALSCTAANAASQESAAFSGSSGTGKTMTTSVAHPALSTQITTPDCRTATSCQPTQSTRITNTRSRTRNVSIFERLFGWLPEWLFPQVTNPNI